jgi:hypothetical protein
MLIIAIPKSASTSLMSTLGDLYKLPFEQQFKNIQSFPINSKFINLANYHSDCRELDHEIIKKWTKENKIYKQHVIPTENNMQLLKNHKKVILLRKPYDIICSYRRSAIKNLHKQKKEFKDCETKSECLKKVKKLGYLMN